MMLVAFYMAGAIAIVTTLLAITRFNPFHALLYLIVSLMAVAVVFYTLGAPFIAVLEVIIYAGAIMVLFIFVVMLLNLGRATIAIEREWVRPGTWWGPSILAAILIAEIAYLLTLAAPQTIGAGAVTPKEVARSLYGPYFLGIEMASFLLMSGLVGAYHLGRRREKEAEHHDAGTNEPRSIVSGDPVRVGTGGPFGTP
ncbi:MAG: NADH-quinone oxidoreductase subunit J [Candidatus Binataceae bacterium]